MQKIQMIMLLKHWFTVSESVDLKKVKWFVGLSGRSFHYNSDYGWYCMFFSLYFCMKVLSLKL